ncbi:putative ribonuclease H-like domain-containing protein [Tanacetum coccineum]
MPSKENLKLRKPLQVLKPDKNETSNNSKADSEISLSVFDVRSSDEESTPANDRSSKADRYHAVSPPMTGNFLTPRADISFAGKTNEANTQKPKTVYESVNRDKVIIEDLEPQIWKKTEFKNHAMNEFYAKKGIKREFSVARTPQQNGDYHKKNKTLIEGKTAITMIAYSLVTSPLWAEAVNNACYITYCLPLQPDIYKIPGKDVAPAAHEKPSKSSPLKDNEFHKDHPKGTISRDPKSQFKNKRKDPKASSVQQALVEAMQRRNCLQFKLQKVWVTVSIWPYGKKEEGKGIDYDEVFAPVARIEAIRLFLAFASYMGFTVYQMDVKSAFLYGTIEEEVYVHQPPGFVDPAHPNKVYKVIKALYGLHQAPRAWYETLSSFLMENGFRRGTIDKTLFIKKKKSDIMLVQVYVDDIIFGSTKKSMCTEFEDCMHKRFQMSSMGELTFFLGLQVKQQPDGIFISQDKYVADILKKFDFWSIRTATTPIESNKPLVKDEDGEDVDVHVYRSMIGSLMYLTASRPDIMFAVCACARFQVTPKASHLNAVKRIFRYLKHQPKLGLWYPRDSPFELEAFSDSDYGGASLDRKSTTGGCQFLGRRLISWQCKKQTIVANSTTEAEYVAAANCCGQVLWIQNQMMDYGFNFMNTKIHIDNESTISVIKNPVAHSRTKHIEI